MKRQIMTLLLVFTLVANLFSMAAFAQELPDQGDEELCEHLDTETVYESAGDWLHAVTEQCVCSEEVDAYEEECLDEDENSFCDLCEAELLCLHQDTELSFVPGEEDRTHIATETCACGEEVDTYEEACVDEDGDGYCDGCEAELPCLHEDTTVTYQPGQKEESHIAVTLCSCGEEVDALVESCEDADGDCFCDGCGTQLAEPITLGDTDGDGAITEDDAQYVLRYVVRMEDFIDTEMADVDGDGMITAMDATCILCYCEGLIEAFPGEA